MTEIKLDPETYVSQRVEQYRSWYDRKAVSAKAAYLRMRAFAVVAGGTVPVLVNIKVPYSVLGCPLMTLIVTVTSLLVVIAVSLEAVFHYREQWKNYRSTEQLLGHKLFWFCAGGASMLTWRKAKPSRSSWNASKMPFQRRTQQRSMS